MFDPIRIFYRVRSSFGRRDILFIFSLIVVYFASRLYRLDQFPIFSDEGIYIHWAKTAWHDAAWRFISLTDGKQPLQTWGTIPFLKLYPDNALLAGRLFAVATGFFALTGMFTLLYHLFGKRTAYIGSLVYVVNPYFLFYDRMALVDSGVNGFFIWILFFSILLAKSRRLDVALIMGFVTGFALLAKSSAQIFLGMSALAPIFFITKRKKETATNLLSFAILFGLVIFLSVLIYNVQRLSPYMHYVAQKNTTFVMTFEEFKKEPFSVISRNIWLVPQYVSWESGFFFSLLGIGGLLLLIRRQTRLGIYLTLWLLIPYVLIGFFSKVLFPRYTVFMGSLLAIGATYLIAEFAINVKRKGIKPSFILFSLYLISIAYASYTILFDYKNIPMPPIDRGQYVEGWTAGWGMRELVEYTREKSREKPVIILADGNFGLSADMLDTFLKTGDRISIRGYWPLGLKELLENQKDIADNYVYVVLAHEFTYPPEWPIKLIKRYDRPGGKSVLYLFELVK